MGTARQKLLTDAWDNTSSRAWTVYVNGARLVEHRLAKAGDAGSNPVVHSVLLERHFSNTGKESGLLLASCDGVILEQHCYSHRK